MIESTFSIVGIYENDTIIFGIKNARSLDKSRLLGTVSKLTVILGTNDNNGLPEILV